MGCVESKKGCNCYTNQATPYPTRPEYCHEVVTGHRFNPYLQSAKFNDIQQEVDIDHNKEKPDS